MGPIRTRNKQSNTTVCEKNKAASYAPKSSTKQKNNKKNLCEQNCTGRPLIIDQELCSQTDDISSQEMAISTPDDQPVYATLQPVPINLSDNLYDPPDSPLPLVIDTTEEMICSQSSNSNRNAPCPLSQVSNQQHTSFGNNVLNQNLRNDVTHVYSTNNSVPQTKEREVVTNNNAMNAKRTSIVGRNTANIYSQSSSQSIVVSVDRSQQDSFVENTYIHRTSTPLNPTRKQSINDTLVDDNESFSTASISSEKYQMLSQHVEFRRLVKAYSREQQKCQSWINDYARLKRQYDKLETTSFPRPSANALNYLLELVAQIQHSNYDNDRRTDEELANTLGISSAIMATLKDKTPQQTALNIFHHLYPGYHNKANIGSVNDLELMKPGLIETILVIAQRSAPGVRYKKEDLRDALNSNLRGARFQLKKMNARTHGSISLSNNAGGDLRDSARQISENDMENNLRTNDNEMETYYCI